MPGVAVSGERRLFIFPKVEQRAAYLYIGDKHHLIDAICAVVIRLIRQRRLSVDHHLVTHFHMKDRGIC